MIGSEELLNERYAKALFESASDQGLAGKVMEELELFNDEWLADRA